MLNFLPTQRLATYASRDHDSHGDRQCCGPQSGKAAVAGSVPALPRHHSWRLGHCNESEKCGRNHAIPTPGRADAAPVSGQNAIGDSASPGDASSIVGQARGIVSYQVVSERGNGAGFNRSSLTGTEAVTPAGTAAAATIVIQIRSVLLA